MRWVFASLLAGLVTVVLFFGMMRVEVRGALKAYEAVTPSFQTEFSLTTWQLPWQRIGCGGPSDRFPTSLPKPEMSQKAHLLDQAQVALLNTSRPVSFDVGPLKVLEFETPQAQFSPIGVTDSDACVVTELPVPKYPMMRRPLEADCETAFFIDAEGRPFDIEVQCSEPVFVRETERAISRMRWAVRDQNGELCPYIERTEKPIHYPMQYRLQ